MTGPDDEFRTWLLATFREEAEEHLGVITDGLIALEKAETAPPPGLIEAVYRETHSLKGAARAVNLRDIELVCQNLENAFSAMKRGDLIPDAEAFDLFHRTVKFVRVLLSGEKPQQATSTGIVQALRALHDGRKPAAPVMPKEHILPDTALPDAEPARQAWNGSTVRIAAHKLDRLIAGSDDLLTTRLFITQRMRELEDMMTRFGLWRWNHTLVLNDLHLIREASFGAGKVSLPPEIVLPLQRVIEFLEYDREFVTYLQHDLATHIRATEVDRAALEASTSEISDLIHDAVLVPISHMIAPFAGFVREFSRSSGKQVDLAIEGGEIEMDRRILETLKDPLMHLVRNSIDHGIEFPDIRLKGKKPARGLVKIRVTPLSGSKVGIEVADDGVGIDCRAIRQAAVEKGIVSGKEAAKLTDTEAIWLIFRSGMSTSPIITDLSGRGLGLAIVEDTVTRLGGDVAVTTDPGRGTSITMIVPVRLATLRGVVVRSGARIYVLPMQQVKQVIRVKPGSILSRGNRSVIRLQEETIRVIRLTDALGIADGAPATGQHQIPAVILAYGAGQIACIVDEVIRVQEIVVRPLGSQLRHVRRIEGAVILGDGKVALVLDPIELIQEAIRADHAPSLSVPLQADAPRILVVEDSVTSRALLQAVLERAGYQVTTATDGIEAFAILKEREFDMVVSDVDMPRMSGFTLTERIRSDARLASLPVVLVTSLDSREDLEQGITAGANAYIVKSNFEKGNLLEVISNLMKVKG